MPADPFVAELLMMVEGKDSDNSTEEEDNTEKDDHTNISLMLEGRLLQIQYLNNSDITETDPMQYIRVSEVFCFVKSFDWVFL